MTQLLADALLADPEFQKAKLSILSLVESYRKKISSIRPPLLDLKTSYDEAIQHLTQQRGQDLFYPYLGSGFGNGAFVELADGSIKYDFISGIGTHWGHAHPDIIAASLEASIQDICIQGHLQQNRDSLELINLLVRHSGMDHCLLTTSGAMANENALKLIFQKKNPANRLFAFERTFMGRTLSLAQITDKPLFREGLPRYLFVDYIPFYEWDNPQESTRVALNQLNKFIKRYPGEHACMCFEMIQGEAGSYPGSQHFFLELCKVLKKHRIAIFVDEVQTFGRTDSLFAFQHFGLEQEVDVVTCGKLLHTCATLFKKEYRPKAGLISQTFTAATASIRVGKTILKSLIEEGYLGPKGKNMEIRSHFVSFLEKMAKDYPKKITGPFGEGLMIACTPFGGEKTVVTAFARALFDAGIIAFTAGDNPTRLRFLLPAGSITQSDIEQAACLFEEVLKKG